MGSKFFKVFIVIFWLVIMGWAIARDPGGGIPIGKEEFSDLGPEEGQEWFGVYLETGNGDKTKIGYSVSEIEHREHTRVLVNKSWMRIKVQGKEKTVRTETKILTDLDYAIININFMFNADKIKFIVLGAVEGDKLRLTITTAGGEEKRILPLEKPPVMPETIMAKAVKEGLEVGKVFQMPMFDPASFSFMEVDVRVVDSKTNETGKVFWKMVSNFKGINAETWIDQDGRVQMEKAASFVTIRETKKDALTVGWNKKGVEEDIIDQSKIKVANKIEKPKETSKVTLKLSNIDYTNLTIDGGRQSFDAQTGIVTINRESLDGSAKYQLPADKAAFVKDLEATPTLQVKDPLIVQQTRTIVGSQTDARIIAEQIKSWVFENLDKKPLVSIPSAKDVLEIKRGDCNEHAALYTALARAARLPARIVVGLVYMDGAFYYHAWNKVYLEEKVGQGQWVELDSTFGQFPADATHLRLLEGDLDQQITLLGVIGKLGIEVIEYE